MMELIGIGKTKLSTYDVHYIIILQITLVSQRVILESLFIFFFSLHSSTMETQPFLIFLLHSKSNNNNNNNFASLKGWKNLTLE